MENVFDSFIESFNAKYHLHNLVRHAPLEVCVDTEQGVYYLCIESEIAYVPEQPVTMDEGVDLITISTSHETAQQLLSGRIKLRDGEAQQRLTISGSLRATLLLEAILFLAKPDVRCA